MPQNYRVKIAEWRPYVFGNVIPDTIIRATGSSPDELVERGIMEPTNQAVNCDLRLPNLTPIPDPTADIIVERNELRERCELAERTAKIQEAQLAEKDKFLAARDAEIGRLLDENGQLRSACTDHQQHLDERDATIAARDEEIAVLKDDLEKATAPQPKRKKETAAA